MDSREERRLLVRIAQMYYEEDMTQSQISKELGIYRTSISRWLKKAREEGIVKISINRDIDDMFELEQELIKRFHLREAIVVATKSDQTSDDKKKAVASASADFLKRIIKDDDVIGFAWGTTVASMIGEFTNVPKKSAHFVPLVGGPGPMDTKHHVNTIVYKIAEDFRGRSYFIDAAAVVERKETKRDIVKSNYFKKIAELWSELTIAVVGIGNPNQSSNLVWAGFCGDQDIDELNQQGAIGDICSRFYDIHGNEIKSELSERTIAIDINKLKETPYSIAVAESVEKAPSIIGGMRGGYINTLVTTDETALAILNAVKEEESRC